MIERHAASCGGKGSKPKRCTQDGNPLRTIRDRDVPEANRERDVPKAADFGVETIYRVAGAQSLRGNMTLEGTTTSVHVR